MPKTACNIKGETMKRIVIMALISLVAYLCFAQIAGKEAWADYGLGEGKYMQDQSVTIGDGEQPLRLPIDFNWQSSLFETVYLADEFQGLSGLITQVKFYNQFTSQDVMNKPTRIWLGHTTQTDLASGWIPSNHLTLVFDGNVDYPVGSNTITINLQAPFYLSAGANLVMMVKRPLDTEYYSSNDRFRSQTVNGLRSRIVFSDDVDFDPANPPATSNVSGQFPQTTFVFGSAAPAQVSGTVTDGFNQPLAGVEVSLNHGMFETVTDAGGFYQFTNLDASDYFISFEAYGYHPWGESFALATGESLVLDVTMEELSMISVSGVVIARDTSQPVPDALVQLQGYADYEVQTDAEGEFEITGVFAQMTYNCTISAEDFLTWQGVIYVDDTDYEMGDIYLSREVTPPTGVTAEIIDEGYSALLSWQAPEDDEPLGYQVWRFPEGLLFFPESWSLITPEVVTELSLRDVHWCTLSDGGYLWAVEAVYMGGMVSDAALSNILYNDLITGTLSGSVRQPNTMNIVGATVRVGDVTIITDYAGQFNFDYPIGIHDVTASAEGFLPQTIEDVSVEADNTVFLNFVLQPDDTPNQDHHLSLQTALHGNYPNPFNPDTVIRFDTKEAGQVRLSIHNMKGQRVRQLIDQRLPGGVHEVHFDGLDDWGQPLASGIYLIRLQSGGYQGVGKMILAK